MPSPDKSITSAWIDIGELPLPDNEINLLSIFLASIILISIFILLRFIWCKPRFVALRKLHYIHAQTDDCRQQLLLVRQSLQSGLRVNDLSTLKIDPLAQKDWQDFCHDLTHACYQSSSPTNLDVTRLTKQARHWIKQIG